MPDLNDLNAKLEEYILDSLDNGGRSSRLLDEIAKMNIDASVKDVLDGINFDIVAGKNRLSGSQNGDYSKYYKDPRLMGSIYRCVFRNLGGDLEGFLHKLDEKLKIFDANGIFDDAASDYYKSLIFSDFIAAKSLDGGIDADDLDYVFGFITKNKLSFDEAEEILKSSIGDGDVSEDIKQKIKDFFCGYLEKNLRDLGWFNEGSEDISFQEGLDIKIPPFQSLKDKFGLVIDAQDSLDDIFNECGALFADTYQKQYKAKMLCLVFLSLDERYHYQKSRSSSPEYDDNYNAVITWINEHIDAVDFDVEQYFKLKNVDLSEMKFMEKVNLSNPAEVRKIKTGLAKGTSRVNYGGKDRFRSKDLIDYINRDDLNRFSAHDLPTKSYETDFYTGFTNLEETGFALLKLQLDGRNKTTKKGFFRQKTQVLSDVVSDIYITSGDKFSIKYIDYLDQNGVTRTRAFINVNLEAEAELVSIIKNPHYTKKFAQCCQNQKFRSLAKCIESLREESADIDDVDLLYKRLLDHAFEKSLRDDSKHIIITPNLDVESGLEDDSLDPSAIVPIFEEIISSEKCISADSISITLVDGSDLSQSLRDLREKIQDVDNSLSLKGRAFPILEVVLNCNNFLFDGVNHLAQYKTRLTDVLSDLDFLGVRKLKINSSYFGLEKFGLNELTLSNILQEALEKSQSKVEVSFDYCYRPNAQDVAAERRRAFRERDRAVAPDAENIEIYKNIRAVGNDHQGDEFSKGHQFLLNSDTDAQAHTDQDLEQEQEVYVEQNEIEDPADPILTGMSFEDELLVSRSNIVQKIQHSAEFKVPPEISDLPGDETGLLKIWDEIIGGGESFNDPNKKLVNEEFRFEKMTKKAALILYKYKVEDRFAGGLNLKHLPQGFYLVKNDLDGKLLLDFDISRGTKSNPLTLDFANITKYEGELSEGEYGIFDEICENLVEGVDADLVEEFKELLLQPFSKLRNLAYLSEKKAEELIGKIKEVPKEELKLFLQLVGNSTQEAKNTNPILLIEPFLFFKNKLRDHDLEIKDNLEFKISQKEDLRVICYRIIEILRYIDKEDVCEVKRETKQELKQRILDEMLTGKISLAEHGIYHGLYCDGLVNFDADLKIDGGEVGMGDDFDGKLSYLVGESELLRVMSSLINKDHVEESDLSKAHTLFLRYVATPVKDRVNEIKVSYEEAKDFISELAASGIETKNSLRVMKLFLDFKIRKFEPNSRLIENFSNIDDLDVFSDSVSKLKNLRPSFTDISNLAKIYKNLPANQKGKFDEVISTIVSVQPDWRYFSRILENLAIHEDKRNYNFVEIIESIQQPASDDKDERDDYQRKLLAATLLERHADITRGIGAGDAIWARIIGRLRSAEDELLQPKLTSPDQLISFAQLEAIEYPQEEGIVGGLEFKKISGFNYDYFSLDYIKLGFQEVEDLRVIDSYYDREDSNWSAALELKKEESAGARRGAKYLNFLNKFDAAFRIDFLRVFVGERKINLKDERLLKLTEKSLHQFATEFLSFDDGGEKYSVSVSSRQKEVYGKSFKIFKKMYDKFPSDTPLLIKALSGDSFENYCKKDDKIKFLGLLNEFLEFCSKDFSLELFKKYLHLRITKNISKDSIDKAGGKEFLRNIIDNEFIGEVQKKEMLDLLATESNKRQSMFSSGSNISTGLALIVEVNEKIADKLSSKSRINKYNALARPLKVGEDKKMKSAYVIGSKKFIKWSREKLLSDDVFLASVKLPLSTTKNNAVEVHDLDDGGSIINLDILRTIRSDNDQLGFFVSGKQYYVNCGDLKQYCKKIGDISVKDFKKNIVAVSALKDPYIIYNYNGKKRSFPIEQLSDDLATRRAQISDLISINSGRFVDLSKDFLGEVEKKILAHKNGLDYKVFLSNFKDILNVVDAIDDQLYKQSENDDLDKKFPLIGEEISSHKIRNYSNFYKRRFFDLITQLLEYDDEVSLECVKKINDIFKSGKVRNLVGNIDIGKVEDLFNNKEDAFWNSNSNLEILFLRAKKFVDNCKDKKLFNSKDSTEISDDTVGHLVDFEGKVSVQYLKIQAAIEGKPVLSAHKDKILGFINDIFYRSVNISNQSLYKYLISQNKGEEIIGLITKLSDDISRDISKASEEINKFKQSDIFTKLDKDPNLDRELAELDQFDDSKKDLAGHISTLIGDDVISGLMKGYLDVVDSKKHLYSNMSKSDLLEAIKRNVDQINEGTGDAVDHKLDMLALLRESYFRVHNKYPYTTQLLPLIYFVSVGDQDPHGNKFAKIMAEISTGQGKSLLSSVYVAFQAFSGKASHVTSATDSLSSRDFRENQNFYSYLGLKSHYIDQKGINSNGDEEDAKYEKGRIYHSTPSSFYFFLSKNRLAGKDEEVEIGNRSWLSDETDTLLDNKTLWRLSVGGDGGDDMKEFYEYVNNFYAKNKSAIDAIPSADENDRDDLLNGIVAKFESELEEKYEDLYRHFKFNICSGIEDIFHDKIKLLISSAKIASTFKEDKDFVVEQFMSDGATYNCARILKKPSNEPDRSSTWGDGVHQLLHSRLEKTKNVGRFRFDSENVAITSGTPKQLVEYCGDFVGITGTMGQEADLELLSSQFGISNAVKIQPHQLLKRKDMGAVIIDGGDMADEKEPFNDKQIAKLNNILAGTDKKSSANPKGINHNRINGQPVLIICESLEEAKILHEKISGNYEQGVSIQMIDGSESDIEMERKVHKAGQQNMITISTPIAGRGTDIRIGKKSKSEGLYTISMSVFNERETAQIEGRSGRNGAEGKAISLINASKRSIKHALQEVDYDDISNERKNLSVEQRVADLREALFGRSRENLKKQVAESVLIEEKYRRFCFFRNEFLNQAKINGQDEVALANNMENLFANFLNNDVSVCLKRYKIEGAFNHEEFQETVSDLLDERFELFLECQLFPLIKVKCEREEELTYLSDEFKDAVRGRVYNSMLSLNASIDDYEVDVEIGVNAQREKYSADDELYGVTGLYLRDKRPDGDVVKNVQIQTETGQTKYDYKPLSQDGYYSHAQQHMIHFAELCSAGFRPVSLSGGANSYASYQGENGRCYVRDEEGKIIAIKQEKSVILMKDSTGRELLLLSVQQDSNAAQDEIGKFLSKYEGKLKNIDCIIPLVNGEVVVANCSAIPHVKNFFSRDAKTSPESGVEVRENHRRSFNPFSTGARIGIVGGEDETQDWHLLSRGKKVGIVGDHSLNKKYLDKFEVKNNWPDFKTNVAKYCAPDLLDHERLSEFQTQNLFIRSYINSRPFESPSSTKVTSDFRRAQLIDDNKAYSKALLHVVKENDGIFQLSKTQIGTLEDVSESRKFDYAKLISYSTQISALLKKVHQNVNFRHITGDEFEISCVGDNKKLIHTIAETFGEDVNKIGGSYRFVLKGEAARDKFLEKLIKSVSLLPSGFQNNHPEVLRRSLREVIMEGVIGNVQKSYRQKVGDSQYVDGKLTEEFKQKVRDVVSPAALEGVVNKKLKVADLVRPLSNVEKFRETKKRIIEEAIISDFWEELIREKLRGIIKIENGNVELTLVPNHEDFAQYQSILNYYQTEGELVQLSALENVKKKAFLYEMLDVAVKEEISEIVPVREIDVKEYLEEVKQQRRAKADYDQVVKSINTLLITNQDSKDSRKQDFIARYERLLNTAYDSRASDNVVNSIVADFKTYVQAKVKEFSSLGIVFDRGFASSITKDNIVEKDKELQEYNRVARLIADINDILRPFECENVDYTKDKNYRTQGREYLRPLRSKLRVDKKNIEDLSEGLVENIVSEETLEDVFKDYSFDVVLKALKVEIKDQINLKLADRNDFNVMDPAQVTINVDFTTYKANLELYKERIEVRNKLVEFFKKIQNINATNSNSDEVSEAFLRFFRADGSIDFTSITQDNIASLDSSIGRDELARFFQDYSAHVQKDQILNDDIIQKLVRDVRGRINVKRQELLVNEATVKTSLESLSGNITNISSKETFSHELQVYKNVLRGGALNFASLSNIKEADKIVVLQTRFEELQKLNGQYPKSFKTRENTNIIVGLDPLFDAKHQELFNNEQNVKFALDQYSAAVKGEDKVSPKSYNSVQLHALLNKWIEVKDRGHTSRNSLSNILIDLGTIDIQDGIAEFGVLEGSVGEYQRLLTLNIDPNNITKRVEEIKNYFDGQRQSAIAIERAIRNDLGKLIGDIENIKFNEIQDVNHLRSMKILFGNIDRFTASKSFWLDGNQMKGEFDFANASKAFSSLLKKLNDGYIHLFRKIHVSDNIDEIKTNLIQEIDRKIIQVDFHHALEGLIQRVNTTIAGFDQFSKNSDDYKILRNYFINLDSFFGSDDKIKGWLEEDDKRLLELLKQDFDKDKPNFNISEINSLLSPSVTLLQKRIDESRTKELEIKAKIESYSTKLKDECEANIDFDLDFVTRIMNSFKDGGIDLANVLGDLHEYKVGKTDIDNILVEIAKDHQDHDRLCKSSIVKQSRDDCVKFLKSEIESTKLRRALYKKSIKSEINIFRNKLPRKAEENLDIIRKFRDAIDDKLNDWNYDISFTINDMDRSSNLVKAFKKISDKIGTNAFLNENDFKGELTKLRELLNRKVKESEKESIDEAKKASALEFEEMSKLNSLNNPNNNPSKSDALSFEEYLRSVSNGHSDELYGGLGFSCDFTRRRDGNITHIKIEEIFEGGLIDKIKKQCSLSNGTFLSLKVPMAEKEVVEKLRHFEMDFIGSASGGANIHKICTAVDREKNNFKDKYFAQTNDLKGYKVFSETQIRGHYANLENASSGSSR